MQSLSVNQGMPLWLAFFLGNAFSTALLHGIVTPQVSKLFNCWLYPSGRSPNRVTWAGAALVLFLYAGCLLIFSRFP
jgi:antibiotic biosynthesis monooxygenase (ABM) superfamily enzyme